jgi:sugar lactone lactonase YvrE
MITMLADGLNFPECPRTVAGEVWFVDTPHVKVLGADGKVRVHATLPAPLVLGLALLPDGSALANDVIGRRVYRIGPRGKVELFADLSGYFPYPINEVVVDPEDGAAYVGSMGFDMLAHGTPQPSRLARIAPDGSVSASGPEVLFPNGMLVEGRTLFLAESLASRISAFPIGPAGLGERTVAADLSGRDADHPDGLARDPDGTIWYADPMAGHVVAVGEGDGRELARYTVGLRHPTACAVIADRIYVTATAKLADPSLRFSGAGALFGLDR